MNSKNKILYLFTVIFLVGYTVYSVQSCSSKEEQDAPAPEADEQFKKLTDADYVGSETCQSCHSKEYNDWEFSHHDQAMMEPDEQSVKGDFNNTTFTSGGVTSRFFKKNGSYYVNTQGPDGEYKDFKVAYTYGITPLQQYIVEFPDGRLQVLGASWDVEKKKWFELYPDEEIRPDEWLHWTQGAFTWNTMCSDCHSTNVQKNFDEETGSFNTTYSIIDVSCEACHGPGTEHVEWANSPDANSQEYDPSAHLDLTTAITAHEQVDQCARCHSRRVQHTEAFNHEGEFMDHYTPEILRDDLYYPDGQILDEVYVYGSFVQSKMYQNNVKCSDCHNPHSLELKMIGNALCGQCHTPTTYDTPDHHFHAVNTESAECVSCHMTGRTYMGNDFRRDHSFRVPRPDLSVNFDTPNACNGCHEDQSAEWAAKAIEEWYGPDRAEHYSEVLAEASTRSPEAVPHLIKLSGDTTQPAIVRATAIWYLDEVVSPESVEAIMKSLNSEDNIVRYTAINALADLPADQKGNILPPLLDDEIRTVRLAAANALVDVPAGQLKPDYQKDFERAIEEYKTSLAMRADFPGGQFEKGRFYERSGMEHLAEQAYLKAIEFDDHLNVARVNLAHLYNSQGKNQRAIELFKTVIEQEPEYGMAYYSLGLLLAEENDMEGAIEYLSQAAEIDRNVRIYYNLGIAYQQTEQPDKAEDTYLEGLEIDPNDQDLMYALSILYVQQEKFRQAMPYVKRLLEIYPNNNQLNQMWRMINSKTQAPAEGPRRR